MQKDNTIKFHLYWIMWNMGYIKGTQRDTFLLTDIDTDTIRELWRLVDYVNGEYSESDRERE